MKNCRLGWVEAVVNCYRFRGGSKVVDDVVVLEKLKGISTQLHNTFLAGADDQLGFRVGEHPHHLLFADGVVVTGQVPIAVFNPAIGIDDDIGIESGAVGFNPAEASCLNLHRLMLNGYRQLSSV